MKASTKLIKGAGITLSVLFFCYLFSSLIAASDFDFYANELIAKESYRRISMDFKDASLKNILKIFSEQAGLNFIASQEIQDKTLTLYLDNVPLQQALDKIMSANHLTYDLEPGSNIFTVKETGRPVLETQTKIYALKYSRLKNSRLESAIAAGASGFSISAQGGIGASAGGTAAGGGGGSGTNVEDVVSSVLTSNGKLITDTRTNSLIVTDIPSQFEVIDRVIALLDVPAPQVMIEVEMLDVDKQLIDELGVSMSQQILSVTGGTRTTPFPFNIFGAGMPIQGTSSGGSSSGTSGTSYGTISAAAFNAVLELLTTDSRTKYLARPRILTTSNETAEIKIVTNEAIGIKTLQTGSGGGTSMTTVEAERYETGIVLRVTPQVDPSGGDVTMFIQPVVAQAKVGATFQGYTFKDPEVRVSSSTLSVKNGETVVVAGLIKSSDATTIKKVPGLGDLPFVGTLFRHKEKTNEERELIVFLTPRIVGYDNVAALAKVDSGLPGVASSREHGTSLMKKEEVDNTLERWEN